MSTSLVDFDFIAKTIKPTIISQARPDERLGEGEWPLGLRLWQTGSFVVGRKAGFQSESISLFASRLLSTNEMGSGFFDSGS